MNSLLLFCIAFALSVFSSPLTGSSPGVAKSDVCYQDTTGRNFCLNNMQQGLCSLKLEKDGLLKMYGNAGGDQVVLWTSNNYGKGKGPFLHRIRPDGLYAIYNENRRIVWHSNTRGERSMNVSYQLDLKEITSPAVSTQCSLQLSKMALRNGTWVKLSNVWSVTQTLTLTPDQCRKLESCNEWGYGYPIECMCICYLPNCEGLTVW